MALSVAFVHDWLVTYRGGEKVLEALLSLYPKAPIYTLFYDRSAMPEQIAARDVRVPWASNLFRKARKLTLPLLPTMIESLPLDSYDLIISTSSCVAKGARKARGARHVCYLHSPMRYIWDQQDEYLAGVRNIPGAAWAIKKMTPRLRAWDIASSQHVDRFVANSSFVRERALTYWGCDASVVAPPIELDRFSPRPKSQESAPYALAAGALVSYKRFDLAIAACAHIGKPLIIAGDGPMLGALRQQAAAIPGARIDFVVSPDNARMAELLAGAEVLLFPGVEDFGMIAIEAMASGTPVLAYAAGGARDFIVPGETGQFFPESNVASLAEALVAFKAQRFDAQQLSRYAARYSRQAFLEKMRAEIADTLATPPQNMGSNPL